MAYDDWMGMAGHTVVMAGVGIIAICLAVIGWACMWVVARIGAAFAWAGIMVKHLVRRAP